MAWNKEDRSFKILIGKQLTGSNKKYYEEFGDTTLSLYFEDIKTQPVPFNNPTLAVSNGVAQQYTQLVLVRDTTVDNNQGYASLDASQKPLKDWISDAKGAAFTVTLYNNGVVVPITHDSQWFFDYPTGILTFNGDSSALNALSLSGYRYIGKKGLLDAPIVTTALSHADFRTLKAAQGLKIGSKYTLIDHQTIHQVPGSVVGAVTDTGSIYSGNIEPLVLTATGTGVVDVWVVSPTYPLDLLRYDADDVLCEDASTPRKGRIHYREDRQQGVSAHYDWRNVRLRRWVSGTVITHTVPVSGSSTAYTSRQDYLTFNDTAKNVQLCLPTTGNYNNVVFQQAVSGATFRFEVQDSTFVGRVANCTFGVLRSTVFATGCSDSTAVSVVNSTFTGTYLRNHVTSLSGCTSAVAFTDNTVSGSITTGIFNSEFTKNVVHGTVATFQTTAPCTGNVFASATLTLVHFQGGINESTVCANLTNNVFSGLVSNTTFRSLVTVNTTTRPLSYETIVKAIDGSVWSQTFAAAGNLVTVPYSAT